MSCFAKRYRKHTDTDNYKSIHQAIRLMEKGQTSTASVLINKDEIISFKPNDFLMGCSDKYYSVIGKIYIYSNRKRC